MSFRMISRTVSTRAGTWSHVRFSRAIGAVPSAEMIDVRVEKLFKLRHFYSKLASIKHLSKSTENSRQRQTQSA